MLSKVSGFDNPSISTGCELPKVGEVDKSSVSLGPTKNSSPASATACEPCREFYPTTLPACVLSSFAAGAIAMDASFEFSIDLSSHELSTLDVSKVVECEGITNVDAPQFEGLVAANANLIAPLDREDMFEIELSADELKDLVQHA